MTRTPFVCAPQSIPQIAVKFLVFLKIFLLTKNSVAFSFQRSGRPVQAGNGRRRGGKGGPVSLPGESSRAAFPSGFPRLLLYIPSFSIIYFGSIQLPSPSLVFLLSGPFRGCSPELHRLSGPGNESYFRFFSHRRGFMMMEKKMNDKSSFRK